MIADLEAVRARWKEINAASGDWYVDTRDYELHDALHNLIFEDVPAMIAELDQRRAADGRKPHPGQPAVKGVRS